MSKEILDIYTDYLICQNKYATSTGLADLMSGEMSHDKITRFLNKSELGSKELWNYVKPQVRKQETCSGGVLILDDSIEEKPYTDENEIICWHHSHMHGRHIKGVNILSCLIAYEGISLPVGYEIVHKDIVFSDIETKKIKRKASVSKNDYFRNLITTCVKNKILFDYVLADNWFGSAENMEYIANDMKKQFIIGIKSNRTVALSKVDKISNQFWRWKMASQNKCG
jgi:hypothetical protein